MRRAGQPSRLARSAQWRAGRESELHRKPLGYRQPADLDPDSTAGAFNRHLVMWNHESSVLTQLRTGKVGLKGFLFQRRVPEIATPHYHCGSGEETPAHLALCTLPRRTGGPGTNQSNLSGLFLSCLRKKRKGESAERAV